MNEGAKPHDLREVPQMHQRSVHHDYHGRGIYLITLCTEGRQPLLGQLTGSTPNEASIEPTALGTEVLRCWDNIPALQRQLAAEQTAKTGQPCTRDITLLARQLMPDHFHGIIFVRKEMDIALGDVIRGFMIGCTKAFNGKSPQICGAPNHRKLQGLQFLGLQQGAPQSLGLQQGAPQFSGLQQSAPQFSGLQQGAPQSSAEKGSPAHASSIAVGCSAYTRGQNYDHNSCENSLQGGLQPLRPLWQRGYHDRLLTHEGQLQNMIDYVRDNPRRLMLRRLQPKLFAVQRNVSYAHWTFSAIGRLILLDAPLTAVHVRRYFNDEERRDYMNKCILAARYGNVLVSPFISEQEKQVRDEALSEGHFCIQLCREPFSDYHKPPGELIDYCYDGHLLLLSAATEAASTERRISRDECSALNALAESMARESLL